MKLRNKLFYIIVSIFIIISIPFACSKPLKIQETKQQYYISHKYRPNQILLLNSNDDAYCIAYFMHTDKRIEVTKLDDAKNKTIINLPDYVVGQNLLAENPDTIYIFENIHKTLYMLNGNQDIKSLNLNFNNKISDYRFKVKVHLNKNSLYVNAYYFSDHSNINSHTELEREKVKDLSDNESIVVFDNLFSNNICMNQVLNNFTHDNILKSNDYVCTENLGISFTQDYAICFHGNTNVLYVFDKELNNLITTVELKSRFSSLKVPFVKLFNTEDEIADFIKNRQEVSFKNGVIYNVVYDEYRSLYYIITLLPNLDFHYMNNPITERDWSLIVLNKDFKNLGEFLFSKSDYNFLNILPLKEGILLQNAYKQNENEKTFFTLFEVL